MIYFQTAAEHCFGTLFARQNRTYFSQQQIVHKSKLSTQILLQHKKKSPFEFHSFLLFKQINKFCLLRVTIDRLDYRLICEVLFVFDIFITKSMG